MYSKHRCDARESREDRNLKMSGFSESLQYIRILISVLESHREATKSIFDIDDMPIVREIIIKKSPSSNDYLFFSLVYRKPALVFLCIGQ